MYLLGESKFTHLLYFTCLLVSPLVAPTERQRSVLEPTMPHTTYPDEPTHTLLGHTVFGTKPEEADEEKEEEEEADSSN